jgi:hypothetical protein
MGDLRLLTKPFKRKGEIANISNCFDIKLQRYRILKAVMPKIINFKNGILQLLEIAEM